jgi:DnaJ-domain-containing protein 1
MPARSPVAYWGLRLLAGLALLALAGSGALIRLLPLRDPLGVVNLVAGLGGFWIAYQAVTPFVRALAMQQRAASAWNDAARDAFARASLPRRIYYLLASVADADAPMSQQERDAVRHFVLERFADPVRASDLQGWETQPFPIHDRKGLAARIAVGLDDAELDSVFCWCCLVAFADGRFGTAEHEALQEIRQGLGIPAPRARMLFHLARAQFLRGDRQGEQRTSAPPPSPKDARARALDELGLPHDASVAQIRKRHRELVRRFHPDAQPHLGPAALREATERFTAIQRAYETLTNGGASA